VTGQKFHPEITMKALVTCSGISNTGKLTTQAALLLMQRRPGMFVWMHAKQSATLLEEETHGADQIIIIDGCDDCCAEKRLAASSIVPHHHVIATHLGIEKNGMADVRYNEIETVVAAVMETIRED